MEKTKEGKSAYKSLKVSESVWQKLKYMSKATGMPISILLSELIENLFEVAGTYTKANIQYESSVLDSELTISVSGRKVLVFGSIATSTDVSDGEVDKMVKAESDRKFEERKTERG